MKKFNLLLTIGITALSSIGFANTYAFLPWHKDVVIDSDAWKIAKHWQDGSNVADLTAELSPRIKYLANDSNGHLLRINANSGDQLNIIGHGGGGDSISPKGVIFGHAITAEELAHVLIQVFNVENFPQVINVIACSSARGFTQQLKEELRKDGVRSPIDVYGFKNPIRVIFDQNSKELYDQESHETLNAIKVLAQ